MRIRIQAGKIDFTDLREQRTVYGGSGSQRCWFISQTTLDTTSPALPVVLPASAMVLVKLMDFWQEPRFRTWGDVEPVPEDEWYHFKPQHGEVLVRRRRWGKGGGAVTIQDRESNAVVGVSVQFFRWRREVVVSLLPVAEGTYIEMPCITTTPVRGVAFEYWEGHHMR